MENKLTFVDIFALLLTSIMWALSFPFIKLGLDYYPPIMLGALRYLIGAMPIILYLLFRSNSLTETKILFKSHGKYILAIGIFMVTIPNITQNVGMQYTTASLSTLIQSVGPVIAITLAIIILKESVTKYKIIGTVLALSCSLLLILYQGIEFDNNNLMIVGNVLQFVTAVSYGINSIFSKVAVGKVGPFVLVGWSMFIGSIILFPISIATEPQNWIGSVNIQALWVMAFLAAFPACIATALWYWVLKRHELSKQVLFIYLLPFIAIVFSYILLDEVISTVAIILGILTIVGVAIAQKKPNNHPNL